MLTALVTFSHSLSKKYLSRFLTETASAVPHVSLLFLGRKSLWPLPLSEGGVPQDLLRVVVHLLTSLGAEELGYCAVVVTIDWAEQAKVRDLCPRPSGGNGLLAGGQGARFRRGFPLGPPAAASIRSSFRSTPYSIASTSLTTNLDRKETVIKNRIIINYIYMFLRTLKKKLESKREARE